MRLAIVIAPLLLLALGAYLQGAMPLAGPILGYVAGICIGVTLEGLRE